jgi:hypothetical protein
MHRRLCFPYNAHVHEYVCEHIKSVSDPRGHYLETLRSSARNCPRDTKQLNVRGYGSFARSN